MKPLLFLLLASIQFFACGQGAGTANAKADLYDSYGDSISANDALSTAQFEEAIQGKDSLDAKMTAVIIESCSKQGCWMDVKMTDGSPMKVLFRDHAFFIPLKGMEGKEAVFQGKAVKDVTDVDLLRHYAEDAGKSAEEIAAINEPETSWIFTADGVLIKK